MRQTKIYICEQSHNSKFNKGSYDGVSLLSCGQGRVACTRGSLEFGDGIGGSKGGSFLSFADGCSDDVFIPFSFFGFDNPAFSLSISSFSLIFLLISGFTTRASTGSVVPPLRAPAVKYIIISLRDTPKFIGASNLPSSSFFTCK